MAQFRLCVCVCVRWWLCWWLPSYCNDECGKRCRRSECIFIFGDGGGGIKATTVIVGD
ncbi:hypothetical protein RDWZM_001903, partial [Blomia tropicalis]